MKAILGFDAAARKRGQELPVEWNTDKLANPHIAIAGMSGSGKTYTISKMITAMAASAKGKIRFHMFDVHGDMNLPGSSSVLFSEQTPYGLNPLRILPDPHYGGVRKRIQSFISIINKVSPSSLGIRQESVISKLLYDLYKIHGFNPKDPATWKVDESNEMLINGGSENKLFLNVNIAEKDDVKGLGARWDPDKKMWWIAPDQYKGSITRWLPKTIGRTNPTIEELLLYAERLMKTAYMGSDQKAVMNLEIFHKHASAHHKKVLEMAKRGNGEWTDAEMIASLDKAKDKTITSLTEYLTSVRTGAELEHLMNYGSLEVLKSVVDRLRHLVQGGIFKNKPMPFDDNVSIWHYQLQPLSTTEQTMFVLFRLEEIWERAFQRGQSEEVREVVIIDEFSRYATMTQDDPDNIISVLAREARKFGIALIVSGQEPTAFPESIMSSIGTTIVLGVHETYWPHLMRKMRMDESLIKWIKLQQTIAVQFKEKGATRNDWKWTHVK